MPPKFQHLDAKPRQKLPQRSPAERAKAFIARRSEPIAGDPSKVKLKLTLFLRRTAAEQLAARAIEQDRNLVREIFGAGRRRVVSGHSITRSARTSSDGGMVRPSALAVLRLMTSSNLVGCSTGRSAGLAPFRILST
jgi:hypothetical protein